MSNVVSEDGKPLWERPDQINPLAILGGLLVVLIWGYWNSLTTAAGYWDSDKYSHGYLIPLFTLTLLFLRFEPLGPVSSKERWWGVGLLSVGLGIRMLATFFPNITPEMYSFVPAAAGLVLLVGGWKMFRWAGPPVGFLIFMFPLPGILDRGLLAPLQKIATRASTYCLQTMGIPSYYEGNTILVGDLQMGVVEACSGLRMLTIFLALAVAITLVTSRPLWERIVIVVSAVPIALAVNMIRITVTGILYFFSEPGTWLDKETVDKLFHIGAGWVMMPLALGFLFVEAQILSRILIDDGPQGPLPIGVGSPRRREPVSANMG